MLSTLKPVPYFKQYMVEKVLKTLFCFLQNIPKIAKFGEIFQNRTESAFLALETELLVN